MIVAASSTNSLPFVFSMEEIASDTIYRQRLLCAYCIQNVNSCELVLEATQYHIVLIAQRCNCMLVHFMYSRISVF